MIQKIFFMIMTLYSIAMLGMQSSSKLLHSWSDVHCIVIPGQNGLGGDYINNMLPYVHRNKIHRANIPSFLRIDFGQNRCMDDVEYDKKIVDAITNFNNQIFIFYGSSQGTATLANLLARGWGYKKVKCVILEGVMPSGNRAIYDHVGGMISPLITMLPLSYYWLPYVAKILFPLYSPGGEQPIFNVAHIPKDIPFIIVHHKHDPQLSFEGAKALCVALRRNGNPVHFIEKDSEELEHVNLIGESYIDTNVSLVNSIIEHYLFSKEKAHQLYDPTDDDNQAYEQLYKKEKRTQIIGRCLYYGALFFAFMWVLGVAFYVLIPDHQY